jgi:hypothetical protein
MASTKAQAYVREINSINAELKSLTAKAKVLRKQKFDKQALLYKYMKSKNMEVCDGTKIKSITPKDKIKRKPDSEKKKDAIELFRVEGINDPDSFYEKFKRTQKYVPNEEEHPEE